MSGMINTTGAKADSLAAHVRQSVNNIITTPIKSRVMRRDYGSVIPDLIDQPLNATTLLKVYAATAAAVMRWEPRFKVASVQLYTAGSGQNAGQVEVQISGAIITETNATQVTISTTL